MVVGGVGLGVIEHPPCRLAVGSTIRLRWGEGVVAYNIVLVQTGLLLFSVRLLQPGVVVVELIAMLLGEAEVLAVAAGLMIVTVAKVDVQLRGVLGTRQLLHQAKGTMGASVAELEAHLEEVAEEVAAALVETMLPTKEVLAALGHLLRLLGRVLLVLAVVELVEELGQRLIREEAEGVATDQVRLTALAAMQQSTRVAVVVGEVTYLELVGLGQKG